MPRLQDPLTINGAVLRNRLVLPPITTNFGTTQGEVTPEVVAFYQERAGDVGLLIVEAATVRADGRITPYSLGLWHDGQVNGLSGLVKAIKARGSVAAVQLGHAGARCVPVSDGIRGASPSGVPFRPDVEPTALNEDQIQEIVEDFARGAVRAREAGFDGVEIHGAHFYLISQFLSPLTNRRLDRYGGDSAGRATMALEVVRAVRKAVGPDYPVMIRLNAVENIDGGQSIDDAVAVARLMEEAGVDAIHVSLAATASWREVDGRRYLQGTSALPKDKPMGDNLPLVSRFRETVGVPLIAVGKLGDLDTARGAVESGIADLVAIGRQMIADPYSAGKLHSGKPEEIVRCRECMACFGAIGKAIPVSCGTNLNLAGAPRYHQAAR